MATLQEHVRIDEGIKRPKAQPKTKKDRSPKGQWITAYKPEAKRAAIEDALERLEHGETTDQIAARHGMPGITLRTWLIADPRTDPARAIMVAAELSRTLQDMTQSRDPLSLARAREEFRGWAWIAERRVPSLYAPKQEVTHVIDDDLGNRIREARLRTVTSLQTVEGQTIEGQARLMDSSSPQTLAPAQDTTDNKVID